MLSPWRSCLTISLLPYCWIFPEISCSGSLQPWNLLWRWRSLRMRSYCHFTRWACSDTLIRFMDKKSPMCSLGPLLSYSRWMFLQLPSPILSPNYSSHKGFTKSCKFVYAGCCRQQWSSDVWLHWDRVSDRAGMLLRYSSQAHTSFVRCNTFKPSLPEHGGWWARWSVEISITRTSGCCTLLTSSVNLSRWKLSRRFQRMCPSWGELARVMVSSQSSSHSRTY